MSTFNNTGIANQPEGLSRSTGGLPFDRAMIPLAVTIAILFFVIFLSQVPISQEKPSPKDNGLIAPLFTPEVQYWAYKIIPWSEQYLLDPNLIATIMQIESCGHPKAKSSVGAIGLFQVMPYHFSTDDDPFKPNINARRGLAYLKQALAAGNGDTRLAFAGYNGGITGAKSPESSWPAETIRFVYWGMDIYRDALKGKSQSNRLDEWLAAGGASLCKVASVNLGLNQ